MTTIFSSLNYHTVEIDDLVLAAQDGDSQAFGELTIRFEGMVFALALRRLGDYSEAEELTQEVFVKAYEKLYQLEAPGAFAGWLRAITTRMAINRRVRRPAAMTAEPQVLEAIVSDDRTPLDDALRHERAAVVRSGLARLGELDRTTLVAFYFEGQSLAEMSADQRAPIGTIKRRLHVARKRLARELETSSAV
jgi:RNA polymerase sigma-70 factor (ECF subfamily)